MSLTFTLAAVFLLSLIFLAMVYGEKLSVVEFFDGRWLTATSEMLEESWFRLCEGLDDVRSFISEHFWWVTAATSGTTGVVLIALMMFSGLSQQALAVKRDENALINAGSVLDFTPEINATSESDAAAISTTQEAPLTESGVSNVVYQVPSSIRFRLPQVEHIAVYPEYPEFPAREYPRPEQPTPGDDDFPPLFDFGSAPVRSEPVDFHEPLLSRETDRRWLSGPDLRLSLDSTGRVLAVRGREISAPALTGVVDRAIASLRWNRDDWLSAAFRTPDPTSRGSLAAPLREDSDFAVRDMLTRVDVIPGRMVSANDLRVEKNVPATPGDGGFSVEIRVQNTGQERIGGLLLRELLPFDWQPTDMQPVGVYRADTVTWLIDELDPLAERVFRLDVTSDRPGRYESRTEISAIAAVASPTRVQAGQTLNRQPLPPALRPDVRLTLEKPIGVVQVGKVFEVLFNLTNVGDIAAEGVDLRVTLDRGLGHHTLDDSDPVRRIENGIARLAAGDSRRIVLKLRAIEPGLHSATAQMLLQDSELDLITFRVDAGTAGTAGTEPTDLPPDRQSPGMFE
ncbi:MAG: hypothetical protein R3C19_15075 [Planctomycetaceae bacterium]